MDKFLLSVKDVQPAYDEIRHYELGRKEKVELFDKPIRLLAQEKKIEVTLLFGSVTRIDYLRDIDLCISANVKVSLKELLSMGAEIELELGMPVDLIEFSMRPPTPRLKILHEGILAKGTKRRQCELLVQSEKPT